jgi:ubiquinone/menaquinone biosynthesis C-methylase UbiE
VSNADGARTAPESYEAQTAYRDETVALEYDRLRFHSWRGRLGDWLDKRALTSALAHIPGDVATILDTPCGTGRITAQMAAAGYTVVGADISAEMVKVAHRRFSDAGLSPLRSFQANAIRLPIRNNAFGCATAIRFMGHVPSASRVRVLRELARVSQGYIVADFCLYHPLVHMRRRIEIFLRIRRLGFAQSWDWQSIRREQLENEFQAAGLQAVRWFAKARFLSDAWMVLLKPSEQGSG